MSSSETLMKVQKKAKRPPKGKFYNPLTQRYKWKSCPKYQILDRENTGICIDKSCVLGKELNFIVLIKLQCLFLKKLPKCVKS